MLPLDPACRAFHGWQRRQLYGPPLVLLLGVIEDHDLLFLIIQLQAVWPREETTEKTMDKSWRKKKHRFCMILHLFATVFQPKYTLNMA